MAANFDIFYRVAQSTKLLGDGHAYSMLGALSQNLWYEKKNRCFQIENNIEFYLHVDALRHHLENQSWIVVETIQQYRSVIIFFVGAHHIYLQPWQYPKNQWLTTNFLLKREEIKLIIQDWLED